MSRIWVADQPADARTPYPAGEWSFRLVLGPLDPSENLSVEIGALDETGVFLPHGSLTLAGQGDNSTSYYTYEGSITVTSFAVPPGGLVAARLSTSSSQRVYLQVGTARSFVRSPDYPAPAAPSVTTVAPEDVGQTTAILRGRLDALGNSEAVSIYFEWGPTTDYGSRAEVGRRESSGSFSAAIAALVPNTLYHFRAVAEGNGTAYGPDLVFVTQPLPAA